MVTAAMKLKDTPWKESYDQPRQHIKKQRHYFVNKGPASQGYGFSNSESWTIKKAEHWRTDAFDLWSWRRLLRVPWAFYSVPLIYISVFVPVPYCLDDCGFVVEPEVR